jgi:transposase
MPVTRKRYGADFKAKVALEAVRGERTLSEIAVAHGVNPVQVTQWKKQLESDASSLFCDKRLKDSVSTPGPESVQDQLYKQIGELTVEVNWLKKKSKQLG